MPWESIGDCGDGQVPKETDWLVFELQMGIMYLKQVCGGPPKGYELVLMWHTHDYGDYPTIGISWEDSTRDAPWEYIQKCEIALSEFDSAVNWDKIKPEIVRERFAVEEREDDDPNE